MDSRRAGSGRVLGVGAALLLAASAARADGLRFIDDLPDAPHVLIDLTDAQRREIAAAGAGSRWPWPEIRLTRAQRDQLRSSGAAEARWVFAASKEALAGDCTCGIYNLGVVAGSRLAVLRDGLGDHLGPGDVAAMERALTDPGLRVVASEPSPSVSHHRWGPGQDAPEPLRALVARFPGDRFDTTLRLGDGWSAKHLRVAVVPRVGIEGQVDAAPLQALSAVSSLPSARGGVRWPEFGARIEADGRVTLLVPGIVEAELGPRARAWFLLEYRDGRLTAAAARWEWGWTGASYEWTDAEER